MNLSLDKIKKNDDILYSKVFKEKESLKNYLKNPTNNNQLFDDLISFISDIEQISEIVDDFNDYLWLSNAAIKWHSVLSTVLEFPKCIKLSSPKRAVQSIFTSPKFTEKEIEDRIDIFKKITLCQITEKETKQSESYAYQSAKKIFVSEILDGQVNFAGRISPESYWYLEETWVTEIKELRAYFAWIETKSLFYEHEKHFFDATNYLRSKLAIEEIKGNTLEFKEAKNYIQTHYLDEKGRLRKAKLDKLEKFIQAKAFRFYELTGNTNEKANWKCAENLAKHLYKLSKENLIKEQAYSIYEVTGCTDTKRNQGLAETLVNECYADNSIVNHNLALTWLIREKAYRIYETTNSTDMQHNWILAEMYVEMFYESIIPAVEQNGTEENNEEKILRVLKAFQYSKSSGFLIKNCFELSLAIYFLNPKIIRKLWKNSESKPRPESNVESSVCVIDWPNDFKDKIKFNCNKFKNIDYKSDCDYCKSRLWFDNINGKLIFKGVMLDKEYEDLLETVKTAFSNNQEYINAITILYNQSRLIHEDTTL